MDALPGMGLPVGWASATLGELCDVIGGITVDAKRGGPGHVEVPYLRVANVQRGRLDLSKMRNILVPQAKLGALTLQHGDVLLNEGGDRDKVGRGWVWEDQLPQCVFQNHVFRARVRDDVICPYFLSLYLNEFGRDYFLTGAKQTTNLASISLSAVKGAPVVVPPRTEQARIVAAVNALFEELEAGEAALARAREGLTQFRASLLHAACTGALTADWRSANPTNETADDLLRHILAFRRDIWLAAEIERKERAGKRPKPAQLVHEYCEPEGPRASKFPPLPSGWIWASLGQLCHRITSGSRNWGEKYAETGAALIRAQDIKTDTLNTSNLARVDADGTNGEARTQVRRDDLLITITGANVAKAALVDANLGEAYVSQHVGLCSPVMPETAAFLHLSLICGSLGRRQLLDASYGAGKPGLNLLDLARVTLPLPPLAEQAAILSAFNAFDTVLPSPESNQLRQSILHAAFTGRLVPQDPADEPAAALLARLRATPTAARRPRARRTATQPDLIETNA